MKQSKIIIKAVYTWYNVYVDNTLLLKHLTQDDINDLIQKLHDTNTAYDLKL